MQHFPLLRAKYAHAFSAVLDRVGAPTERFLDRAGLSGQVLEHVETIVPAHRIWSFIGFAAEKEGIHDLGIQAGCVSIEAFGEFSRQLCQGPNLYQAVQAFCQFARFEYSRADFYISRRQDSTWFCRGPIDGRNVEKKHVELMVVMMMIATVQLVAGPAWYPADLFLQTEDPRGVRSHQSLASADIHFGSQISAFEIPSRLLPKRLSSEPSPSASVCYEPILDDFVSAIRHIVIGWPTTSDPKINHVAEAVGISRRTLQRRLDEANTNFTALVEDVRMNQAMRMLTHSTMSVSDIALELRYSDQANFTRAFRRWTGLPPQTYRSQLSTDEEDSAG